jgi:hypothetical protein
MIWLSIALLGSVLILAFTALTALKEFHEFERGKWIQTDHAQLSQELSEKLKAMDDLKAKMESLLIKNGFGR